MKILLLEDHVDIGYALAEALRHERYQVEWVTSDNAAARAAAEQRFDLAVLDVMIGPREDAGFELAAQLRDAGFEGQLLFVSARDAELDRVRGLDLGGDDYLVKPFGLAEFLARVRALLRRSAQTRRSVLERPPLSVDLTNRRVTWDGQEVKLSGREFELLELFAHYPERVFTVTELQERLFPEAGSGTRVVRVYVSQLRQKLSGDVIETVPGGYRLGQG
jgi:two-component system response regulator QseB